MTSSLSIRFTCIRAIGHVCMAISSPPPWQMPFTAATTGAPTVADGEERQSYGLIDSQTMIWSLEESPEPREGMRAFMEKRAPNWVPPGLAGGDAGV